MAFVQDFQRGLSFLPALIKAKDNIQYVYKRRNGQLRAYTYEYMVASWGCSMICKVFRDDPWIITPERKDANSNKRPDLTIERWQEPHLRLHAVVEFKKLNGAQMEKLLEQVRETIIETVGEGTTSEVFVIVQRGFSRGFFEFLPYLDPNNQSFKHFRGMVSLTQQNQGVLSFPDPLDPLQKQVMEDFWSRLPPR